MDLMKLFQSQMDLGSFTNSLSNNLDADQEQISKATSILIPELLSGMSKNVSSEKGLSSLFSALDDHQDTDISDANAFLSNVDLADGQKILGHLLGNNASKVEKKVAKETGLGGLQVNKMMLMLAPLLMGLLGSQKKNQKGFNPASLVTLLGGMAGGSALTSMLGPLLANALVPTAAPAKKTPAKKTTAAKKTTTAKKTTKKITPVNTSTEKQGLDMSDAVDILSTLLKNK